MNTLYINTDGGSRGNPGPAAIGVVFDIAGETHTFKRYIGEGTNNEAEYKAIIWALEILSRSGWFEKNNHEGATVVCRLDSQLVVEQINGNYKVKQEHIKIFIAQIKELVLNFKFKISFHHIPREENKLADKLVNEALDEEAKNSRS
jgi:ribonuclease HI